MFMIAAVSSRTVCVGGWFLHELVPIVLTVLLVLISALWGKTNKGGMKPRLFNLLFDSLNRQLVKLRTSQVIIASEVLQSSQPHQHVSLFNGTGI